MADFTFTIQIEGEPSPIVFSHIAPGTGLFAIDCRVGPALRDILRFHPRGVKGNITIRDKESGRPIVLRARIVGALVQAQSGIDDMFNALRAAPATITAASGKVYSKCNLMPDGARIIGITGADQGGGFAEIDIEMAFTQDGGF